MHSRARWVAGVAGALIVALSIPAATADVPTKAASGTPIKVGLLNLATGAANIDETGETIEAYFKDWNARGGYKGQPLELEQFDVGFDAGKAIAAIQQLDQDGAVAVLSGIAICQTTKPGLLRAGIPALLGGVDPTCYDPSITFATGSGIVTPVAAKFMLDRGAKKVAFVGPTFPTSDTNYTEPFKKYVESQGATAVIENIPLAPTGADLDGVIADLKSKGVTGVFFIGAPGQPELAIEKATVQGYGPKDGITWMLGENAYVPDSLTVPALQGVYLYNGVYAWEQTDIPAVKHALKVVKAGDVSKVDGFAGDAYQLTAIFERATKRVKGALTRESLRKAFASTHKIKGPLSPIVSDLTDVAKIPIGGQFLQIKGDAFVPVGDYVIIKPGEL